jgi:hypothetical protein
MPGSPPIRRVKVVGQGHTGANDVVQLFELSHGHGALQLGDAIIEGDEVMVRLRVAVAPGLVDDQEHSPGQGRVAADDEAAFAGRDVLALLKAEAADVAKGADEPAAMPGAERLGAVLDHLQAAALGQGHNLGHVAGVAEEVRDDDGPRAVGEHALDRCGGDVIRPRIDIGEDGDRALIEDWRQRPHVGDCRGDNFIPRLGVQRGDGHVKGGRARAAGMGMRRADPGGEAAFELLGHGSLGGRERAALDGLAEHVDLLRAERSAGGVLVGR